MVLPIVKDEECFIEVFPTAEVFSLSSWVEESEEPLYVFLLRIQHTCTLQKQVLDDEYYLQHIECTCSILSAEDPNNSGRLSGNRSLFFEIQIESPIVIILASHITAETM